MLIRTFFAILTFASAWAQAGEWHLISTSSDLAKKTYWYVDPASIVIQSNLVQARLRTVWSTLQYGPSDIGYQSTTYLNYVDCKNRSIAFTGNTYFQDVASSSEPVHQEDERPLGELRFMPVRPGSSGEVRVNYLCRSSSGSSNSLT
ncbi:surface-adhesin E family protein [Limnohabitans sp. Jir72]|uniref:surface-adhesin E family protein n=1 Tax=Limnohabitans sp. Jir72 TaxID=1977909 RepID=UPI0011B1F3E8|nr:surface-adhesin E family protein [Limnohabitans sp. Jir72]